MSEVCPYCGTHLGQTPTPGTCPTCGQEVAPAGQEVAPASQEVAPAGQGEAPAGQGEAPPSPPPPPPPQQGARACEGDAWLRQHLEEQSGSPPEFLAWEQDQGNWLAKLWNTTWQVLLHPVRAFRGPARPGQAWAVSYALLLGTFGNAMQALWAQALDMPDLVPLPAVWWLILAPLVTLAGLYLSAAYIHLGLIMVGGAKQGFAATLRVSGYACAFYIFYLVPLLGMMVGGIWGIVVVIGGLAGAHGINGWRVVWAYVLMGFLVTALVVVFVLLMGFSAFLLACFEEAGNLSF